ncbi:MAG: succinate dehydrogenase, hydrophobic membrane anchor protein [Gammaproteobacteria bacterium]|nr:succinate dehydrogenase, hydrophobic membrane anchor protein [Gammaproteobacteria bacterium]
MNTRNTGSAGSGLGEWILQRLSAVYLAVFLLWLIFHFLSSPVPDYAAWKTWFSQGVVRLGFALFFVSLLIHAWVGMRSVFLDYLKPLWLRFLIQMLMGLGLLAMGLWAAQILLVEAVR